MPYDLSAVIVSFNTRRLLLDCLRSLQAAAQADGLNVEAIVVDNASGDGSAQAVATEHPWARVVMLPRNSGFAAASNVGLSHAGGRYPLLLNPDTEVPPGSLARLIGCMDAHPRAAAAGPSLVYPDGSPQHSCFRFPTLAMQFLDLFPLHHRLLNSAINGRYPFDRQRPFEIDHPLGACMILRRAALEALGPLDEEYFMYCEEVDWCWRAKRAGWQVYCVPDARVVHHGAGSTRHFADQMFVELYRSRYRLMARHYHPLQRAIARAIVRLGLKSHSRAARAAAARGELDEDGLARRLRAYELVARM